MAQENAKETFDYFQNDTDILELKNKIKNAQDTYVKTRKRCTHEEVNLKKVEEEHKHIQKQLLYLSANEWIRSNGRWH